MAASDVKKIYQEIINEVCTAVREALSEEGYDDHTLQELKSLWLTRLEHSKALEPLQAASITDQATNREFRHPTTGDANSSSSLNNKQSIGVKRIHPASNAAITNSNISYATTTLNSGIISVPTTSTTQFNRPNFLPRPSNPTNLGNNTMKTSNQVDGANDEVISNKRGKKKSKMIKVSLQLDGTGPPIGDDEDDDEDSEAEGNDVGDDLDDDDDDDGNEEGREDPNPLCSDDDVSEDDEPAELFETDNVVVCQYDKISRTKNKWRFTLKSGVMHIEGRDYVFSKATGDADW
jgi:transcription initiation factor TFIIA large subunit